MRTHDKQVERDTVIYSGRGKESGLDVYELDEPVLFFSPLFLFCHFNHFPSSVPALGCQSIKANASRKGGEMINILRKQLSQTDRVAVVMSEMGQKHTHRQKLEGSRAKQRTFVPQFYRSGWIKPVKSCR